MKYIDIEFQYQMISLPYDSKQEEEDKDSIHIDDSDLSRHKIDYKLWDGFFVPPINQLQTASLSKDMLEQNILDNWHLSLSRVEPFTKFICIKENPKRTMK